MMNEHELNRKVIIYGAGENTELIIPLVEESGYTILGVCDSDTHKQGEQINGYSIMSKENAINICCCDQDVFLINGVEKRNAKSEIDKIIEEEFPVGTKTISYKDIKHSIHERELKRCHSNINYNWDINLEEHFTVWLKNIDTEVDFWLLNGADKKAENSELYRVLRRRNRGEILFWEPDLEPYVKDGSIIMDIGCGLVSSFGEKLKKGGRVKIIPVDALAYYYNIMNGRDEEAIPETYKCNFGMFEIISNLFGEEYADCIFIRNSMDHCWDPYLGFLKCFHALKVGGVMKLSHRRAEAVYVNWGGLHQWNFDCIDGNFVIWNKDNAVNISDVINEYADISVDLVKEDDRVVPWVNVIVKKKKRLDIERFVNIKKENEILAKFVSELMHNKTDEDNRFFEMLSKIDI